MKTLDAVVPIYNEIDILPELHGRLRDVLSGSGLEWRIIYVDDGSADGSAACLATFAAEHRQVSVVHLSRNFGQQLPRRRVRSPRTTSRSRPPSSPR